ncbi:Outer membrane protein TolC [Flexibacter flexilis DSM 6793]|uniref:Outer membrane protein TolC n=1 Tax=Flexibacter flexilis DSM 6793 TaxID=927664 RepID=A0A1I1FLG9_9BACT|nr:TolC family protein [Flexibacter flexilis]SFC00174.1 Outer membrane protein TolC [Flexibacter flexilis DSM 6793]
MKIFNSITFLLVLAASIGAHSQNTLSLSMQEAQNLGLQNRYDVKAMRYDLELADKKIQEQKNNLLPDLKATGNIHYSPKIQATFIPPGFVGMTEGRLVALGAKSTSIFALELHQPLYNPSLNTNIQLAQSSKLIDEQQVHLQEIEIKKQISYSYLNVLLRQLQHDLAKEEERRFETYAKLAEGKHKNGTLVDNDFLRAKLDYENAQQQTQISKQNYDYSLQTLRYQLNVTDSTTLVLTDKLGVVSVTDVVAPDYAAADKRIEYQILSLEEKHNILQGKKQRQMVLPTLSFVANYSAQYLNAEFNYDYTMGKWWSSFSGIGLQLSVPLTGQFTNRNHLQQISLESQKIRAKQEHQKQTTIHEIEQASSELANAAKNFGNAQKNYELAKQIFQNQQQQLQLGSFSYEKILNTESTVTNTEENYVLACYNYLVARLNYTVAVGQL